MSKKVMTKQHNRVLQDSAQVKEHYKMYKVGKLWMFAGLFTISFGAGIFFGENQDAYAEVATAEPAVTEANSGQSLTQAKSVAIDGNTKVAASDVKASSEVANDADTTGNSQNNKQAANPVDTSETTTDKQVSTNLATNSKGDLPTTVQTPQFKTAVDPTETQGQTVVNTTDAKGNASTDPTKTGGATQVDLTGQAVQDHFTTGGSNSILHPTNPVMPTVSNGDTYQLTNPADDNYVESGIVVANSAVDFSSNFSLKTTVSADWDPTMLHSNNPAPQLGGDGMSVSFQPVSTNEALTAKGAAGSNLGLVQDPADSKIYSDPDTGTIAYNVSTDAGNKAPSGGKPNEWQIYQSTSDTGTPTNEVYDTGKGIPGYGRTAGSISYVFDVNYDAATKKLTTNVEDTDGNILKSFTTDINDARTKQNYILGITGSTAASKAHYVATINDYKYTPADAKLNITSNTTVAQPNVVGTPGQTIAFYNGNDPKPTVDDNNTPVSVAYAVPEVAGYTFTTPQFITLAAGGTNNIKLNYQVATANATVSFENSTTGQALPTTDNVTVNGNIGSAPTSANTINIPAGYKLDTATALPASITKAADGTLTYTGKLASDDTDNAVIPVVVAYSVAITKNVNETINYVTNAATPATLGSKQNDITFATVTNPTDNSQQVFYIDQNVTDAPTVNNDGTITGWTKGDSATFAAVTNLTFDGYHVISTTDAANDLTQTTAQTTDPTKDNLTITVKYAPAYTATVPKVVNETIKYVDQNGNALTDPAAKTYTADPYSFTTVTNPVAGTTTTYYIKGSETTAPKVNNDGTIDGWTKGATASFDAVTNPTVNNYHVISTMDGNDLAQISAKTADPTKGDIQVTVTYAPAYSVSTPKKVEENINYITNDTDFKQLGKQSTAYTFVTVTNPVNKSTQVFYKVTDLKNPDETAPIVNPDGTITGWTQSDSADFAAVNNPRFDHYKVITTTYAPEDAPIDLTKTPQITVTPASSDVDVTVTYAPAYTAAITKTVNETINYVDQNNNPVSDPFNATNPIAFVTVTNPVGNSTAVYYTTNKVTKAPALNNDGTIKDPGWTKEDKDNVATFDAVPNPTVAGYHVASTDDNKNAADLTQTGEQPVTSKSSDVEVTVTYAPDTQKVVVELIYPAEDKTDPITWTTTGPSTSAINYDGAAILKLVPKNYTIELNTPVRTIDQLISNFTPNFDTDTAKDQTEKIYLGHAMGIESETTSRTIHYIDESGNAIKDDTVQTIIWTAPKDLVTNIATFTPLDHYPAMAAPEIDGYTLKQGTVNDEYPMITASPINAKDVTLTYTADKQTVKVQFVDQNGNKLGDATELTGGSDSNIDYAPALAFQKNLISQGYQPIDGDQAGFVTAPKVFDHDDKVTPTITVKLTKIAPVSADLTLVPVDGNGNPISNVTMTATGLPGTKVNVPEIPGYTPTTSVINIPTPVPNEDNVTNGKVSSPKNHGTIQKITYTANPQSILVQFVDKDNKDAELGPAVKLTGVTNGEIDLTNVFTEQQKLLNQGYTLAGGNNNGLANLPITFSDSGKVPIYVVELSHIRGVELTAVPYAPYANQYTINIVTTSGTVVGTKTVVGNPGNIFDVTDKVPNGYVLVNNDGHVTISNGQDPQKPIPVLVTEPSYDNGGPATNIPSGGSTDEDTGEPTNQPTDNPTDDNGNTTVGNPDNNTVTSGDHSGNKTKTTDPTISQPSDSKRSNNGSSVGLTRESSRGEATQGQQVDSNNKAATLPQTNEQTSSVWALLGLSLMSLLSLFGFKKREDEK